MSLDGRVALVTGASRGIGRAIAEALAAAGADVACVATTVANADQTASAIRALGRRSLALECDVSDSAQVQKAVAECLEQLGKLDVLVNNAGITRDQLILRMSDEEWDAVLNVNLKGAFSFIRAAAKPMMKARYGRIVNVTSVIGISGQAGQANYAASKAGLIGLTKSVAKEFGSRGITCNAIAPGFIESDMTKNLADDVRSHIIQTTPVGRLGHPSDVAGAAVFLASEESAFTTGQVLVVDGGLTL